MGNIKCASKIDLSNQNLKEIPKYVITNRNLKELNISGNNFTELPKELFSLRHLKKLDISNNKISTIYADIAKLQKLEVLNLNKNLLKALPNQLFILKKLTKLLLNGNQIGQINTNIDSLQELRYLALSNNNLIEFPKEILKLKKLERLWLNNNKFHTIPLKDLKDELPNLKGLYTFSAQIYDKNNPNQFIFDIRGNVKRSIDLHAYENAKPNTKLIQSEDQKIHKMKNSIFISYSHKDLKYKEEVETSLKSLRNVFPDLEFNYWSDTQIKPGSNWFEEIENKLVNCDIAIMLVSRNFLASDFIMKKEVPALLEKLKTNGVLLLSIVIGKCLFEKSQLRDFQAVNSPNTPLNSLKDYEVDIILSKLEETITDYFNTEKNN
ncbi:leucine-rich repeat domain-containing protein [Sphingobacterium faecium]|uniref:leucine-rich repeat domain-containing protein n=1 Tax=Sphingobacterium faecium TaxID=34087 RepID=UPI003207E9D6